MEQMESVKVLSHQNQDHYKTEGLSHRWPLPSQKLHSFLPARLFGGSSAPQTVFAMKPEAVERPPPVLRWTPESPGKLICSINYSKHHLPGEGSSSITVTHNKTCSTEHYSITEWAKHGVWCPGRTSWKMNKSLVFMFYMPTMLHALCMSGCESNFLWGSKESPWRGHKMS